MDNPAALLNQLFTQWESGTEPAERVRGISDDHVAGWRRQARAVELVREVELAVEGLEADGHDVSSHKECLAEWYEMAFAYPEGWRPVRTGIGFSAESSRVLRGLATLLNVLDRGREVDVKGLIEVLAEAESVARDEPGLTDVERRYILALIVEARRCVEEIDTFGVAEGRRITLELGGALMASYGDKESIPQETKNRVATVIRNLFAKIGWKGVDTGLSIGQTVIEKAIEQ